MGEHAISIGFLTAITYFLQRYLCGNNARLAIGVSVARSSQKLAISCIEHDCESERKEGVGRR